MPLASEVIINAPYIVPQQKDKILCALCCCGYCEEQSHIIPAFVFRYLKKTSPTGYLRGAGTPNQRVTDGPKHELLCGACEDRLSVWEGRFAQQIWRPLTEGLLGRDAFEYGDWLARFAVSVTWRALTSLLQRRKGGASSPEARRSIDTALQIWAEFLRGERTDVGAHQVQMFLMLDDDVVFTDLAPGFTSFYLERAVDHATFETSEGHELVVKMGRVILVGSIEAVRRGARCPAALATEGGFYVPVSERLPASVGDLVKSAHELWLAARDALSERQRLKVEEAVGKYMDRIRGDPR
jgi:hypothetical protein